MDHGSRIWQWLRRRWRKNETLILAGWWCRCQWVRVQVKVKVRVQVKVKVKVNDGWWMEDGL